MKNPYLTFIYLVDGIIGCAFAYSLKAKGHGNGLLIIVAERGQRVALALTGQETEGSQILSLSFLKNFNEISLCSILFSG